MPEENGRGRSKRAGGEADRPYRGRSRPGDEPGGRAGGGRSPSTEGPRRGRFKGDRERRESRDLGYGILTELSAVEKALSSGDFEKQKLPLQNLLRELKRLKLRSIEQLDLNSRGRLLTTLLRVGRQKVPPRPEPAKAAPAGSAAPAETGSPESSPAAEAPPADEAELATAAGAAPAESATAAEAAPAESATAAEAAPAESGATASVEAAAAPEAGQAEAAAPAEAATAESPTDPADTAPESPAAAEGAPAESSTGAQAPSAAAVPPTPASPEELRWRAYQEVMFLIGSIWRAAGDQRRAEIAFEASGRNEQDEERPPTKPEPGTDWREEARVLDSKRRTRDAARIHEQHRSYAEAARLFEAGGDLVGALRCLLEAKDLANSRRLLRQLKPAQYLPLIERAKAYQLLMEHYVESGDFENVARLYERARQFDQAALAWERSGKLASARKAFERAKDALNAERIRKLEIDALVQRGDRLGAALLWASAGNKEEAVQALMPLPAPKVFRFLQKLKLDQEALDLANKEIARAEAEKKPGAKARWLELLGDVPAAAGSWEEAGRRDKALALQEQAGNWQRAAELAEALGLLEKAAELYHRAGDKPSADRVEAMRAKVAAPPPSASLAPLEGQGEER